MQDIKAADFRKDDAVLCRNTKPLVELAYSLIRQGVACRVEGRSIGEGLIKLATRWKVKTIGALRDKVSEWAEREIAKASAKGQDSRCAVVEDQAATLQVMMDIYQDDDTVHTLVEGIRKMFGDTEPGAKADMLTLSTIHKSKGREWNRVFAWGMNKYSPSKWARKPWEQNQECNLLYVQVTRAKRELVMVNVP
jgi:superfamily I DNA/RNA helicase